MNINNKCKIWLNNNATAGWRSTNIIIYSHIYTDCFSLTSAKAINLFNTNKCQILYVASHLMFHPEWVTWKSCSVFLENFYLLQNYTQCSCITFSIMVISHLKKYLWLINVWSTSKQVYIVSVHIHIKTKVRHVHVHVLYIYVPAKGEKNNLDV